MLRLPPLRAALGAPRRALALAAARAAVAVAILSAGPAEAGPARAASAEARSREAGSREAVPAPVRRDPHAGAVVYATRTRAYLDAGAADGLAFGVELRLTRGGHRAAGTCLVELVAPHWAICRSGTARVGDTFPVRRPAPPPAPKPLPRLVATDELERRGRVVAASYIAKLEAKQQGKGKVALREAGPPRAGALALSHVAWTSSGRPGWQQERADVVVRGAEIGAGIRLHADLRALRWTARPGTARSAAADPTQVLVWQAELAARDPKRPISVALGRVQPWRIPGATVFDGVQVGLRRGNGGEIGLFGGAVPELETLAPTLASTTAGAYGSFDLGGKKLTARNDLRAAVVTSPETGSRFEGELRSSAMLLRRVNVSGDVRIGVGGKRSAPGALDGCWVELSGRPLSPLLLSGSFRYWGLGIPDAAEVALFPGRERRGDVSAGWDLFGVLVVSAVGGFAQDLTTGLERRFAGPEVSFPRLFGWHGGLSAGYREERGWAPGRSAYAQAVMRPLSRLRLTARLYWAADARLPAPDDQEAGVFVATSADLGPHVSLRAAVLARAGGLGGAGRSRTTGLDATVGIAGGF